jgi:glycosyltransferase involved in cell wall biosynthesis
VIYAIRAAKLAGIKLKIAGKHYSEYSNDTDWEKIIQPQIDGKRIEYVGYIKEDQAKIEFLSNAKCLIMPSTWEEPFGMSMIEALACGTPIVGFDAGSISEIIKNGKTGFIVKNKNTRQLASAIKKIGKINRLDCFKDFEQRFSAERMCEDHVKCYMKLIK